MTAKKIVQCECGHEIATSKIDKIQCGKCYKVIHLDGYKDKRKGPWKVTKRKD